MQSKLPSLMFQFNDDICSFTGTKYDVALHYSKDANITFYPGQREKLFNGNSFYQVFRMRGVVNCL